MRRWLVGVDGGERSLAAMTWAVRAIGPDGHLDVVHVRHPATPPDDRIRAAVEAAATPNGIEIELVEAVGDAAAELVERATRTGADAIVVGTHRRHLTRRWRMGTTVRALLREPPVTVVIVPDDARVAADAAPDRRPVVVGAGHGIATDAAVDWAAAYAIDLGRPLWLVRAIGMAPGLSLGNLSNDLAYYLRPSQRVTWAVEDLHELSERIRDSEHDGLEVAAAAVRTTPSTVLTHASRRAALVVVGLHRSEVTDRDRADWTLRHVLARARTPVAVVPAGHQP